MENFLFKTTDSTGYFFDGKLLHHEKTQYQDIKILHNKQMGNILLLNDYVMITQKDEYQYHELITHPNCIFLKEFNKALIVGGGDGLCARELLKYPFKKVELVEIDEKVSTLSQQYFNSELEGTFQNKRFSSYYQDALTFLDENYKPVKEEEKYSFISLDLTDPTEEFSHAHPLFNGQYYQTCKNYLTQNGILVVQIGCPYTLETSFLNNVKQLKNIFQHVCIYGMYMRCYGTYQYFASASNTVNIEKMKQNIVLPQNYEKLKLYNTNMHEAMFYKNNEIINLLKKINYN
jgi:spermidine synthase